MIKVYIKKHTNNIVNLDEVNKILNDYISTLYKNFDFYITNCDLVIKFDNKVISNIKANYFCNTDYININRSLLYDIDCFKSRGHKFYNINQMVIIIISDKWNMTYEYYINKPMSLRERKKIWKVLQVELY